MPSVVRRFVATCVLVVSMAACSDAGADAYYDRLAAIGRDQDAAAQEVVAPGTAPTRDQIHEIVALRRDALDELRSVEPPDEVAGLHREYIGSLERLVTLAEAFLRDTSDLDARAFADALAATTEIEAAQRRFSAFCRTLEIEAAGLGVGSVDLSC